MDTVENGKQEQDEFLHPLLNPNNWPTREKDAELMEKFLSTFKDTKPHPGEVVHRDNCEWVPIRWPGVAVKPLFHPRPGRLTEPSAGIERYDPGTRHPPHWHDFAQVWYILSGEFRIGGKMYGAGSMIYYPDPHYEEDLYTKTGGEIVYVQYQGHTTGGVPVANGMGDPCPECDSTTVIDKGGVRYCNACGWTEGAAD